MKQNIKKGFFYFFCLMSSILFGQEQPIKLKLGDFFLTESDLLAKYNTPLPDGQWTSLDRLYTTPRFLQAMNYIVLNNKADLLGNLEQISAYYKYLGSHPKIVASGIQWQNEAVIVTNSLRLVPVSSILIWLGTKIYFELQDLDPNDPKYIETQKMLKEGVSSYGRKFIDGTASKEVVIDITENYFSPLINGTITVQDPFEFDANLLYREQFVILEKPYYSNFNKLDKYLFVGVLSEAFAQALAKDSTPIDLTKPKERLYIGLRMMGYSKVKIDAYIAKL